MVKRQLPIPRAEINDAIDIAQKAVTHQEILGSGAVLHRAPINLVQSLKIISNPPKNQGCRAGAKEPEPACFGRSRSQKFLAGSGSGQGVDILTIFLEI